MGRKDIKLLVRSVDWSDCQDAQADLCLHCTLKILYVLLFCLLTGHGSLIGSEFAWHASGPEFDPHVRHILSWRLGHENISTAILSLLLMLPTSDHGVAGSNPAGGEILPEPKRRFITQSLSCSPSHRLEMTEILLKGRKTLTHPSIFRWFKKSSCQLLAKECALSTGKLPRRLAQEQCG